MNYATTADMVELFGNSEMVELTNLDDPGAIAIDQPRLEKALDYASREVDSYLTAAQYQLPLPNVPLVLRNKVADIARYHLDSYRAREDVRQRYEDAVKWLGLLAQGKVSLGLDKTTQEQVVTDDAVTYYSQPKVFTSRLLREYAGRD
jgi:phage gp36-like protein